MANLEFNLLDDPWIPVAGSQPVSLLDLFRKGTTFCDLAGDPVERIVTTRFLLAVTHAALGDIPDDEAWAGITDDEIAEKVPVYLEKWRDRFFLYDKDRPFLQYPALKGGIESDFGDLILHVSSGNNSYIQDWNRAPETFSDAQKVTFLLRNSCYMLARKGENMNSNNKMKPCTPGTLLGRYGMLHSFLRDENVLGTLRMNLLHEKDTAFFGKIGRPFWEDMPQTDEAEKQYCHSYQGVLFPLDTFFLLTENKVIIKKGIKYENDFSDPSVTCRTNGSKNTTIWCKTEKKPWRELPSLLSFLDTEKSTGVSPLFISSFFRWKKSHSQQNDVISIWTAGLQVIEQMGCQKVSGAADYCESIFSIPVSMMCGDDAVRYQNFTFIMQKIDNLAKALYGCILSYGKELKCEDFFKNVASQTSSVFWSMLEPQAQEILDIAFTESSDDSPRKKQLLTQIRKLVSDLYDKACPNSTPRQLEAWVNARPFSSNSKSKSRKK